MGSKNRRWTDYSDKTPQRHSGNWADAAERPYFGVRRSGYGCPHGDYDDGLCLLCDLEDEGRSAYFELALEASHREILDLVQRLGADPDKYLDAISRHACIACVLDLILENHPALMQSRGSQWRLLCAVFDESDDSLRLRPWWYCPCHQTGAPYEIEHPANLTLRRRQGPFQAPTSFACDCVADIAPTAAAGIEVVARLLDHSSAEVRARARIQMAILDPERVVSDLDQILNDLLMDFSNHNYAKAACNLVRIGQVTPRILCALEALPQSRWRDHDAQEVAFQTLCAFCERIRLRKPGPAPLSDEDALLLTIWLHPEKVDVYSVYADWLEQQNQPQRAACMRLATAATRPSDATKSEEAYLQLRIWLDPSDKNAREEYVSWKRQHQFMGEYSVLCLLQNPTFLSCEFCEVDLDWLNLLLGMRSRKDRLNVYCWPSSP